MRPFRPVRSQRYLHLSYNSYFSYKTDDIEGKYKDSIADGILLDFYEGLAISCPKLIDETDKEKYMELVKKVYSERYMPLFNQESIDLWEDCKNKFERNLKGFVKINKRS